MSEWQSGEIIADGVRIHYHRTGGDKPPLILSHGLTDQGLCWTPAARELQDEYDIIMPDARGHGQSAVPANGDFSIAAQAADLAALVDELGLEKPYLGGHSMGAMTTLYLIAYHPGLARCAFLEDPPLGDMQGMTQADCEATAARWQEGAQENKSLTREQLIARGREGNPHWADEELECWADAKPNVRVDFLSVITAIAQVPWREALARISCPTLLLVAEKGIVTPEIAAEARGIQSSLQVAQIQGTGHCIRRDRQEEYLRVVRQFLAGC